MAKITEKEMETILQNEIPLDLEVDSGIFEFHECGNVSIGVSCQLPTTEIDFSRGL